MSDKDIVAENRLDMLPLSTPLEIHEALLEWPCSESRLRLIGTLPVLIALEEADQEAVQSVQNHIRNRRSAFTIQSFQVGDPASPDGQVGNTNGRYT
jgi:hypothetical protein